jgi:hypothetical protein
VLQRKTESLQGNEKTFSRKGLPLGESGKEMVRNVKAIKERGRGTVISNPR